MHKLVKKKISELHFDNMNINTGSEFGTALLEKSIRETGLGRSVLTDKHGILIAGNKTVEAAASLGFENYIEIESDGKDLIVVKRTDLDINTGPGMKAKILDNTVNKHNYRENAEMVAAVVEIAEITNLNEYGLSSINVEDDDQVSFKVSRIIKIKLGSKDQIEYALKDINYLMAQKYPGAIVTVNGKK